MAIDSDGSWHHLAVKHLNTKKKNLNSTEPSIWSHVPSRFCSPVSSSKVVVLSDERRLHSQYIFFPRKDDYMTVSAGSRGNGRYLDLPTWNKKRWVSRTAKKVKNNWEDLTLQNCHSTRYSFCGKSNSAATFCYSSTPKLVLNVSNLVCHHVTLYTTSPKLEYRYGKENAGVQSPKPILGGGIIHLPQILKQISLGVASEIVICQR